MHVAGVMLSARKMPVPRSVRASTESTKHPRLVKPLTAAVVGAGLLGAVLVGLGAVVDVLVVVGFGAAVVDVLVVVGLGAEVEENVAVGGGALVPAL